MANKVLELENVTKVYKMGSVKLPVLKDVSIKIEEGEFVAIMGHSGSGKSTIMSIMGLLDRPTEGKVLVQGKDTSKISDNGLARIRGKQIGFVFQSFHLYPTLSVFQNIGLPMRIHEFEEKKIEKKSAELVTAMGLGHRAKHLPSKLSGGEMQRVAIARALSTDPSIILADEPTGNLDSTTSHVIMKLLKDLNKENNKTLVIITHEDDIAKYADRTILVKDGRIAG